MKCLIQFAIFSVGILLGTPALHAQAPTPPAQAECQTLSTCADSAHAKLSSYGMVEQGILYPQFKVCRGTSCHNEDVSPAAGYLRKLFDGRELNEISIDRAPLKLSLLQGFQFEQEFTIHLVLDTDNMRNPGDHTFFSIPVKTSRGDVTGIWFGFVKNGQITLQRASSDFTASRPVEPAYTEDRPWDFATTELLPSQTGMMDVFAIFRKDGKLEIHLFPRWQSGVAEWYAHLFDMGAPVHHYPTQTNTGPPWKRPEYYAISNEEIQFGSVGNTILLSAQVYSAALLPNEMLGLIASTKTALPAPRDIEYGMSPCNSLKWVNGPINVLCAKGK